MLSSRRGHLTTVVFLCFAAAGCGATERMPTSPSGVGAAALTIAEPPAGIAAYDRADYETAYAFFSTDVQRTLTLREFKDSSERAYLVAKLRENAWNISKTAEVIDTPRSNLYKKLEQYQISQERDG